MKTLDELKADWKSIVDKLPDIRTSSYRTTRDFFKVNYIGPATINNSEITLASRSDTFAVKIDSPYKAILIKDITDTLSGYMGELVTVFIKYDPDFEKTPEQLEEERKLKLIREEERLREKEERHKEKMKDLRHNSRLPYKAHGLTFDNYETKTEIQKKALQIAKDICWLPPDDNEDANGPEAFYKWAVTFHGTPGTGKTMLAYIIANFFLNEMEQQTIFWNVPELLNALRAGFEDNSYQNLLERVMNVDILILDDLGMEKTTDWAGEQLDLIIDARYREELKTIVTTNKNLKELQPRISSRLSEGMTVNMDGHDYRLLIGLGRIPKKNSREAVK